MLQLVSLPLSSAQIRGARPVHGPWVVPQWEWGATAPTRVPRAIAFQMVWLVLRSQDWYGNAAPNTGLSPKKGKRLAQNCCASAVSPTSWSARALGLSSLIHLANELFLPLRCPCREVTLALIILKLEEGPGFSASPSLGTRVQLSQRGL